jgi:plasmid maintenance system antidote protein VapI
MTKAHDEFKISDPAEMAVGKLPPIDRPPGRFLRDVILPEYGLTNVAEIARRIDVQRVGLVKILQGERDVSREMAYRFGALLNDHVADLLIAYQHAWDLQSEVDKRKAFRRSITRLAAADAS